MPPLSNDTHHLLRLRLDAAQLVGPEGVVQAVDAVLAEADRVSASDVHFQPTPQSLRIKFRIDGVLLPAGELPSTLAPNVIAWLKVMAGLLTYRTDVPQEGSIHGPTTSGI